jgi:hypothetical protein
VIDLVIWTLTLIPFDVTGSPAPVYPSRSNGLAASLVGGFFGLGIIVLAAILLSLKPRRARPPRL